jgi:hypothetical protein
MENKDAIVEDLLKLSRDLEKIAYKLTDQPSKRGSVKEWTKYPLRSLPLIRQRIVRILAHQSGLEMSTEDIRKKLGVSNIRSVSGAMSGFTQQSMAQKLDELVIKTKRERRQSYWKLNSKYRELILTELK